MGGRAGLFPPTKPFTLVQHNCLGSADVFLSLFGSFTQLAQPPFNVTLQDPPVYWGKLLSFTVFSVFSPPTSGGCKPRVAFYVYNSFLSTISLLPRFFDRGDAMALDLFTPAGFFNTSTTRFTIINSYSTKGRSKHTRSVPADVVFPGAAQPTLTLGDLNIHHHTSDPLRGFSEDEIATSTPYFDRATELGDSLLNTLGVYNHFSMSSVGRPGALDLALAGPLLAPYFTEWSDPLPSTGSDHIPILLRFEAPLFRAPPPSPNCALTDCPVLESSLKSTVISRASPPPHHLIPGRVVQNEPGQGHGPACATHPAEEGHLQVQTMVVRLAVAGQESLQLRTSLLEKGSARCRPPRFRQGARAANFKAIKRPRGITGPRSWPQLHHRPCGR